MKNMKNMKLILPCVALATIALLATCWLSLRILGLGSWSTTQPRAHCTAVVRTRVKNPPNRFMGASGGIVIYKPRVLNGQSSSARIKLVNGANSIEAGWTVNPDVFGDHRPHLYTQFTAKGKTCVNTQCKGFIQVSTQYPLGISPRYSVSGGVQYLWDISIEKHEDWWLFLSVDKIPVGYWPADLFTGLAESASLVEWGGEVTNPGLVYPPPEMGNGQKAKYDTDSSSTFCNLLIVDSSFQQNSPNETDKAVSCLGQYAVLDAGYQGNGLGRLLFYGLY